MCPPRDANMRVRLVCTSIALLWTATALAQKAGAQSAEEVFRKASPAVVTIISENTHFERISIGSGFRIDDGLVNLNAARVNAAAVDEYGRSSSVGFKKDPKYWSFCYILTNSHVIKSAGRVKIQPDSSVRDIPAAIGIYVVTEDEALDLALLQAVYLNHPSKAIPMPLTIAKEPPPVGATVYAIGNPAGLENSLSPGIISGIREIRKGVSWLQTNAAISPGSSGGPLVAPNGTVVGVTTASLKDGQNLNFAISAQTVAEFLKRPYRPRAIWRGSSLDGEADDAYDRLEAYRKEKSPRTDEFAVERFKGAPGYLSLGQAGFGVSPDSSGITTLSIDATKWVPREFEYLLAFTIGKCHAGLVNADLTKSTDPARFNPGYWSQHVNLLQAIREFERARQLNPAFAPTIEQLAILGCEYSANPATALPTANTLIQLVPRCARAYTLRATIEAKMKDRNAALRDVDAALNLEQGIDVQWGMHACFVELRDLEKAKQCRERAETLKRERDKRLWKP